MFQFFAGHARLPDEFDEQYICYSLNLSKTELDKQPDEWVEKMLVFLSVKSEYEKFEMDKKTKKTSTMPRSRR